MLFFRWAVNKWRDHSTSSRMEAGWLWVAAFVIFFQFWFQKPVEPMCSLQNSSLSYCESAGHFHLPFSHSSTQQPPCRGDWLVTWGISRIWFIVPDFHGVDAEVHPENLLFLEWWSRHCPLELSVVMEMLLACASSPMWPLSTWNVASVAKLLNF